MLSHFRKRILRTTPRVERVSRRFHGAADNTRQQVGGCGASLSPRGCYSPQVPVGSSASSQPLFFPELFRSLLFVPVKVRAGLDRGR
ncbi:hypothetical protein ACFX16_004252 [Malus domestica]